MAEKSLEWCEHMLLRFTPNNGRVLDLCAGTASMAMACSKHARSYVGVEPDAAVVAKATERLTQLWMLMADNLVQVGKGGLPQLIVRLECPTTAKDQYTKPLP